MEFFLRGHPDVKNQVPVLKHRLPDSWATVAGKLKALMEQLDEDPYELDPTPIAHQLALHTVALSGGSQTSEASVYLYEYWGVRFGIARQLGSERIVVALLMVEPADFSSISPSNQCAALVRQALEIL